MYKVFTFQRQRELSRGVFNQLFQAATLFHTVIMVNRPTLRIGQVHLQRSRLHTAKSRPIAVQTSQYTLFPRILCNTLCTSSFINVSFFQGTFQVFLTQSGPIPIFKLVKFSSIALSDVYHII